MKQGNEISVIATCEVVMATKKRPRCKWEVQRSWKRKKW